MQTINSTCRPSLLRGPALPRRVMVSRPAPLTVVRATDEDAELEARLAKLRKAKGATPYGEGVKAQARSGEPPASGSAAAAPAPKKPTYDYTNESIHYEGTPAVGDLVMNLALGTTLVWLPLTLASVGRFAFVKYKFTDRRISVTTNAPWKQEQLDAAYQEVKTVKSVPRGIGSWGDMVVELNNGDKIEMLRVDNFKDLEAYILKRRDELTEGTTMDRKKNTVTQEQLMGEAPAPSKSGKGFSG